MTCLNCGMQLPDDSEFCQYCGSKVSSADKQAPSIEAYITPGAKISPSLEKGKQKKWIAATICLSILFLGMTGLNVYQYVTAQNQAAKTAELTATIDTLNSTIDKLNSNIDKLNSTIEQKDMQIKSKNSEITTLKNNVSSLEEDAGNYDSIIDAVKNGNLGYAAYNFKSNENIIVVGRSEKNRKFTLTANWPNGGIVSVDYDAYSPAAYVYFDQDNWVTSTTMTIEPNHTGVTIVTFSNDVNTQTFDVIIVVE